MTLVDEIDHEGVFDSEALQAQQHSVSSSSSPYELSEDQRRQLIGLDKRLFAHLTLVMRSLTNMK